MKFFCCCCCCAQFPVFIPHSPLISLQIIKITKIYAFLIKTNKFLLNFYKPKKVLYAVGFGFYIFFGWFLIKFISFEINKKLADGY